MNNLSQSLNDEKLGWFMQELEGWSILGYGHMLRNG